MTTPSSKIRWAVFIAVALLALAIRLPQLGVRPLHTDESINAYITGQLLAGEKYHYDPQDRHGPVLYLIAKPVVELCGARDFAGLTETQLRLTPALVGSAMILLFGAAVGMFGFIPCLIAALLFALAPLPVYYSRDFIHETLFIAVTFGLILAGWRTLKTNSIWFAALTGLCAALLLACKETAVIHYFALAGAVFVGWLASSRKYVVPIKIIVASFVIFLSAAGLLFTWGAQNMAALGDLVHAVSRFTARAGGEGHEKPFGYYFTVLDPVFVSLLMGAIGLCAVVRAAMRGARQPSLLLAIYALLVCLIYSAIPYKTPWLALNIWLPLTILCGLGIEAVWRKITNPAGRLLILLGVSGWLLANAHATKVLAFDKPTDEKNPYAYAQTGEDLLRLPARLDELVKVRNLPHPRIAVVAADAWPLPWYLRKYSNVGFWQPGQSTGPADFIITTTDVSAELADQLKTFRPEYFGLRPNVLLILWTPPTSDGDHGP